MSDDTPTLRLPENFPPTTPPPGPPPVAKPPRPSRAPLVAFVIVAVLVVVASGLLAYILISRGGVTPGAVAPPSPTASTPQAPAESPAPPPPPPGEFTSFVAPTTARCDPHGKGHQATDLQLSWSTTNATQVWVAAGPGDAVSPGGEQVPLSGTQDALSAPLEIDCKAPSSTFTLTLVGDDGGHVSKTWTVIVDRRG